MRPTWLFEADVFGTTAEPLKAEERTPAPRTTANPRFEQRPAPVARAPSPGSTESAAIATWRDLVVARLQQSKRYPSAAEARRDAILREIDRHRETLGQKLRRTVQDVELRVIESSTSIDGTNSK